MEKLRVADLNLLIDYKYDTMKKQCPPYKANFEKPNLTINIPKEEIIRLQKENPLLSCDDVEYVYTGAAFYEALLHFNGFMLHSSGIGEPIYFLQTQVQENQHIQVFGRSTLAKMRRKS